MIRKLTSACLIAAAALLTVTALAKTSTESACKSYAQNAVNDYHVMVKHEKCRVADSGRWQPNYENHYNWCVTAPTGWRLAEAKKRDAHLKRCGARYSL